MPNKTIISDFIKCPGCGHDCTTDYSDELKEEVCWYEDGYHENEIEEIICEKCGHSFSAKIQVDIDIDKIFKKQNKVDVVPGIDPVSEDKDDDKYLACAVAGKADMIVSNDRHLLDIVSYKGIPIYDSGKALSVIRGVL